MFKTRLILLFFSLAFFSTAFFSTAFFSTALNANASYDYAVIATQQKAKYLLRQLKPLFTDNVKFSATGYQLIVKASPTIIKEIKYVLKQIDRPLHNLIISIASYQNMSPLLNNKLNHQQISSSYSKTQLKDGLNESVKVYNKNKRGSVKVISTIRQSDQKHNNIYHARVIEGNWVYLYTAEEIPYYSYNETYLGTDARAGKQKRNNFPIIPQTQYKEIESGFDAKAVLKTNNQVYIEIKAQQSKKDKTYQKNIITSSANTSLYGNLNEWIKIGSIGQINKNQANINYSTNRGKNEVYYIMVEKVDTHFGMKTK